MYYGHNLRSNLQEWRNRLYKSNYENINNNYRFFLDRLKTTPVIQSILQSAIDNWPLSSDQMDEYHEHIFANGSHGEIAFQSEEQAASIIYRLHQSFAEENYDGRILSQNLGSGSRFDESLTSFLDSYIEPVVNFIHDKLDESNFVLYLLEKYKKRTEWFLHKTLIEKYRQTTQNYEQIFEDDLRLYLFDQGIDNPFSTPKSTSGRADIVGLIDSKDPLILEIKIYDADKGYRKNRVIEGFTQIVKYSNDYNKNVGYLVVFNINEIEIEIVSEDSDKNFPNKIVFNNKVYYIVFINLNFDTSASKVGKVKVETIAKEDLTKEVG
jgi:hypothetical protein